MPKWLVRLNEYVPIRFAAWAFAWLACLWGATLLWQQGEPRAHVGLCLWTALSAFLVLLGANDSRQKARSILRNYPVIGHLRYLLEFIRPELRQYFIESDNEAAPFSRQQRSLVYQRAKGESDKRPFGTQMDVGANGYEWISHSIAPTSLPSGDFRVRIGDGGSSCTQAYDISVFNISAMSFGALSANAILALNAGARKGRFAHDTGEGSISEYHLVHGGDLIWEIGSGYFGCRTPDGHFDEHQFAAQAKLDAVKLIEIKLSQGAKPGHGGVLPGPKVTPEIARTRGVAVGVDCISPASHSAFSTPLELMAFVERLRQLSGGKPVGFKFCVGHPWEWFAMAKAMVQSNTWPDFIVIDGAEGGTGAAPLEFTDHVGAPLQEGLLLVHNTLVGLGQRQRVRLGCAGKVVSGFDILRMMALGADWCNSARGFMFALGCIQAQTCHSGHCPTGVTSQDPLRQRALVVPDKAERVYHFHRNTLHALQELVQAAGLQHPGEITAEHIVRRVSGCEVKRLSELLPLLPPGALLDDASGAALAKQSVFANYWHRARADSFGLAD